MDKASRIKKDTDVLIENGFTNVRNRFAFNYFDDWEKAVMVYLCQYNNELFIKYSMPQNFNIDDLYQMFVAPKIDGEIVRKDMEYKKLGAVFNVTFRKKNRVKVATAKVDADFNVHYKEVDLYGKTKNLER